jgi:hypothetical protein
MDIIAWLLSATGAFIMLIIFLLLWFFMRKSKSKDGKLAAKIGKIGAVIFVLIFLLVAIVPFLLGGDIGGGGDKVSVALAADLTLYEEASSDYDFTHTANDGDVATGVTQIVVDNEAATVLCMATIVDGTADSVTPDGCAVQHDLTWTGGQSEMTYEDATAPGYAYARLENDDWPTHRNNVSQDAYWFDRDPYGTFSIAWTDSGSTTVVGLADGGRMAVYSGTTMSATFYLSIYFDETTAQTNACSQATTMTWASDIMIELKSENAASVGYWSTSYTLTLQFTWNAC